ncbi:MAG: O-antigen ligase family protein [Flavobacteriales bacterium]
MNASTTDWRTASGFSDLIAVHGRVAGWALLASAFALSVWSPIALPMMAFAAVALLLQHRTALRFRRPAPTSFAFWAMVFYALHLVGMAWTADTAFGLFDLEIKAPLLVFPLLLCFLPVEVRVGRKGVLFAMAIGGAASVLLKVLLAVVRIASGTGLSPQQEVFSSAFSTPAHPSYLALYLCVAIAAWVLTDAHKALSRAVGLSVFALLCLGVVLCASKAGWLVLLFLLPTLLALRWKDTAVRNALGLLLVASLGAGGMLVAFSSFARERVVEVWQAVTESEHATTADTSSKVRWVTWAAAWELFKEQPLLGTGTGDIKDELLHYYDVHGATHALELKLNAHQQFLQSAACLGLLGLAAVVCMFVLPIAIAVQRRDALGWIVPVILVGNFMVESMLEVQAGVLFTVFIGTLLPWTGTATDLRRA